MNVHKITSIRPHLFFQLYYIWSTMLQWSATRDFLAEYFLKRSRETWRYVNFVNHRERNSFMRHDATWKIECNWKLRTDETWNWPCHGRHIIFEYRTNDLHIVRIIETSERNRSVRGLYADYYSRQSGIFVLYFSPQ